MATKGQKFNKYTEELKLEIVNKYLNNRNYNKGRRKEDNIDYKERYEILKKYQPFLKAQREKK